MAKYDGLVELLNAKDGGEGRLELTFEQISDVLRDGLPRSASVHVEWWANDSVGHVQSKAWLASGWRVEFVDLAQRLVVFERFAPLEVNKVSNVGDFGSAADRSRGGNGGGHVFVVRGKLENLDCDAVLVPTGPEFGVRRIWASALGVPDDQPSMEQWRARARKAMPVGWRNNGGWGKARDEALPFARPTWFIDSTSSDGLSGLGGRLRATLEDVARARVPRQHDRPRPLLALPVLGVGHGGFGGIHRGHALRKQLEVCLDAVRRLELDVVIVAFEASDYAALQTYRRDSGLYVELPLEQRKEIAELSSRVREGTLAVFFGAGVSMSAGLPSWDKLLRELDDRAEPAGQGFGNLTSALDQAQLLRKRLGKDLGTKVAELIDGHRRYGLSHALLAGLDCAHAVTTNYDQLYERAHQDGHRRGSQLRVLPYGAPEPGEPWLVKMHGDVGHPDDIVLARSDFVGYAAKSGPLGAVVQALLMTEHLLVVGASLSDDNFLRLAHEVLKFRSHHLGTVLKFEVSPAERQLWSGDFAFVDVSASDHGPGVSARQLAIFLDRLAMEAAPPLHLLDKRYAELMPTSETEIAAELRKVAASLAALEPAGRSRWNRIAVVLEQHGSAGDRRPVRVERGEEDAVFVRSVSNRRPDERTFVVEVPFGQVADSWPRARSSNEAWDGVESYLRRVEDAAAARPGFVAPGRVRCIVRQDGKVLEAFLEPWADDGDRTRLGLVVPDLASIAEIPEETIATALRLGISATAGLVPAGWDGTELAATQFMHDSRQRWEAGRTSAARD